MERPDGLHDGVEEWPTIDWKEMVARTLPAARAKLKAIHNGPWGDGLTEFGGTEQKCSSANRWDIPLTRQTTEYFLVEQTVPIEFQMLDIDTKPHRECLR